MKSQYYSIYLLMIIIGLSACEGNTTHEFTIHNKSNYPININAQSYYPQSIDTSLASNQKITLFVFDHLGGQSNPGLTNDYIDSLLIYNDLDTSSKDHTIQSNWLIESEHLKKVPSQYYHSFTLEVQDADFQ